MKRTRNVRIVKNGKELDRDNNEEIQKRIKKGITLLKVIERGEGNRISHIIREKDY